MCACRLSINEAIELTRQPAPGSPAETSFTGIGAFIPGESRVLGTRVAIGYGELAGIARVTAAAPGAAPGVLTIEQSVDGANWDQVDYFTMSILDLGATTFAVKIVGRFIRAVFSVPIGEVYSIRFGAQLKPYTSP